MTDTATKQAPPLTIVPPSPQSLPAPRSSVAIGEHGFAPRNAAELMQVAEFVAKSELKPQGVKTAADAFLIMAVGQSWGFDPLISLQMLHVVKGKVGLPGETCAALIQSHPLCKDYRIWVDGTGDDRAAHVESWRASRPKANGVVTFTLRDARKAGLYDEKERDRNGDPVVWVKYTDDMLIWKAVARDKRHNWPDIYPGLRVKEDYEPWESATTIDVPASEVTQAPVTQAAPVRDPLLEGALEEEARELEGSGRGAPPPSAETVTESTATPASATAPAAAPQSPAQGDAMFRGGSPTSEPETHKSLWSACLAQAARLGAKDAAREGLASEIQDSVLQKHGVSGSAALAGDRLPIAIADALKFTFSK